MLRNRLDVEVRGQPCALKQRQQREHQRPSALRLIHRINRVTLEVRQFMPNGTDLSDASQTRLNDVAALMNSRPGKTLGWKTPAEEMAACNEAVALSI